MAKILVAEDDSAIALMICDALAGEGHAVRHVNNGEAGLAVIAQFKPDLIVTDRKMPRLGGDDMVRQLRQMPGLSAVPIIMVSSIPVDNATYIDLGLAGFVRKPFTDDVLISAVNRAVLDGNSCPTAQSSGNPIAEELAQ